MGRPLRINKAEPRSGGGSRRGGGNNNGGGYNRGGYSNRAGGNNGGYGGGNNGGYGGGNNGRYGGGNNLLELRDGKIEVMEVILTILNMKVVEVGEEEAFQLKLIHLKKITNIPFLEVASLIPLRR